MGCQGRGPCGGCSHDQSGNRIEVIRGTRQPKSHGLERYAAAAGGRIENRLVRNGGPTFVRDPRHIVGRRHVGERPRVVVRILHAHAGPSGPIDGLARRHRVPVNPDDVQEPVPVRVRRQQRRRHRRPRRHQRPARPPDVQPVGRRERRHRRTLPRALDSKRRYRQPALDQAGARHHSGHRPASVLARPAVRALEKKRMTLNLPEPLAPRTATGRRSSTASDRNPRMPALSIRACGLSSTVVGSRPARRPDVRHLLHTAGAHRASESGRPDDSPPPLPARHRRLRAGQQRRSCPVALPTPSRRPAAGLARRTPVSVPHLPGHAGTDRAAARSIRGRIPERIGLVPLPRVRSGSRNSGRGRTIG